MKEITDHYLQYSPVLFCSWKAQMKTPALFFWQLFFSGLKALFSLKELSSEHSEHLTAKGVFELISKPCPLLLSVLNGSTIFLWMFSSPPSTLWLLL